jgi:predicted PP-loop superfamily ATPase
MGETRVVGSAGGVLLTLETGSGQVAISQDDDLVVLNLTVYLAVLLDEAIALAKGEGVKLDKGLA